MKICMLLPPWKTRAAIARGATGTVIDALVDELLSRGVDVETVTTADDSLPVRRRHWLLSSDPEAPRHPRGVLPGAAAHVAYGFSVAAAGDFDVVHDHNGVLGALAAMFAGAEVPPVLHTLHDTPTRHTSAGEHDTGARTHEFSFYREVARSGRGWFAAHSKAQVEQAPYELRQRIAAVAAPGIPSRAYPFVGYDRCSDYLVTIGAIGESGGQHIAARAAHRTASQLVMVGAVGAHHDRRATLRACAGDPAATGPEVRYFRTEVLPYVDERHVCFAGNAPARDRLEYLAHARALVCPGQHDAPFALEALEALACGVPVIAMRRGVMAEIVEDGVNGFLVDDEDGLCTAIEEAAAIDRAACRQSVEDRFSPAAMADAYLDAYRHVARATDDRTARHAAPADPSAAAASAGFEFRPDAMGGIPAASPLKVGLVPSL